MLLSITILYVACQGNKTKESTIHDKNGSDTINTKTDAKTTNREEIKIEKDKVINNELNYTKLYSLFKKSVLKTVCEQYIFKEEKQSISAFSKDSKMFLSKWEWKAANPFIAKDIDSDGKLDYTIEVFNVGGGCGGQVEIQERWTLYGNNTSTFKLTHTIPYRSQTNTWQSVK